jgi:VWFA-related protein
LKKAILAVAVAFAAVATAEAQKPQKQPAPEQPKLVENIDVRVINIDVVVTDRKGKPVQGLTKDDFLMYENGIPKPISNFYEVESSHGAPAQPPPKQAAAQTVPLPVVRPADVPESQKRRIIFYIDNLTLAPFNRNRVFKMMKTFITDVMRPGDEAMIATYNRSMKVRVPFTRDPVQLQQTLDIIAGESAMGTSNLSERHDAEGRVRDAQSYDEALSVGRTYSESVMHDLRQSVESINGLMETLAGVEGKKVLVLTSEGFPMQPGRELFQFIDEQAQQKGWNAGSSMLEGMSFNSQEQIQSIARAANANGITLYTIHAGGLVASNDNTAENARPTSFAVSQAAISNSTESMQLMADMTGGLSSIQTSNYAEAFNKIRRDLDSYYSLGYRAGTERVDRQRTIEVKVKNRNYIVRNRQTFVEKSTFAEMNDRVIANLLYRSKANDLNILVHTGRAQPQEDLFRVPVEIQIPMDSLTLLPQGEDLFSGGFDVYIVVGNKDGDMSDVARKSQPLHVPRAEMEKAKGKYYTYSLELLMEPGVNHLSVGVIDNVSNVTGFDREQVNAKDLR